MKKVGLLLFAATFVATAFAQLKGDGYYRVQSAKQGRYISVIDNRGSVDVSTTSADLAALRSVFGFERVVSDPSSIIYIKKMSSGYDLQTQGTGSYSIISYEIKITDLGDGCYWASASKSGMTKYLMDEQISWMWSEDDPRRIIGQLTTVGTPTGTEADWYIKPVTTTDDNYFGFTPDISVNSSYYQTFYAAFPFTFSSTGMQAYTVTKVDPTKSAVVISELTAGVPSATPVIVKCSSANPSGNKVNVGAAVSTTVNGNQLKGVYFCNDVADTRHRNVVAYDAATMRVLGKAADGSLAFVKQADLAYIPANTAYIQVPAGAPDELKVYTQVEYDALPDPIEPIDVQVVVSNATRKYGEANPEFTYTVTPADVDMTGKVTLSCDADAKSGVGEYTITATAADVENMIITCVNGKLTVTPAQLTVTVADAERVYGQENPDFVLSYAGFVNDDTDAVLIEKPIVMSKATKASAVGTYPITVTGGKATNYNLSAVNGTLTVTPALLKVTANDATRYVGEANPELTLTYEGFVNGEDESVLTVAPKAITTATAESEAGVYEITVSGGKAENYEFEYKFGTLTVLAVDGIDAIIADGRTLGDVYDLKGRKVRSAGTTLEGLPKGVYVINGGKVIVK